MLGNFDKNEDINALRLIKTMDRKSKRKVTYRSPENTSGQKIDKLLK